MIKYLLIFVLFTHAIYANAHQADLSSTMLVEQEEGVWMLQIRAALTAFEYEVHTHFGKKSYENPEEFRNLVLKHLRDHIEINFADLGAVSLQNGFVKLGHETSVIFKVENMPDELNVFSVTNSSFQNIHRNQSALVILKKGWTRNQFVLNNDNEHRVELEAKGNKILLKSTPVTSLVGPVSSYYKYFGVAFILVVGFFIVRQIKL